MNKFSDIKKYFEIDFNQVISEIMNLSETKQTIIDYNQKEQLQEGIDALGKKIETISAKEQKQGEVYSIYTIVERKSKGLQVNKVDLKDTGAFWDSFNVKVSENKTEVLADFSKGSNDIRDNFESKYDFLGLNENSLDSFTWNYFYDIFSRRLKSFFRS